MNLLVVIPAYNEAENIERVVGTLTAGPTRYDYVVVNDGSRDATAEICRARGFHLIDLPVNLGLAGAVQTGLAYAYRHGYDAAVQFDADGQHRAEYIAPLCAAMEETGADIVIGSRFVTVKKPKSLRMVGSYLISWAMRLTTGVAVCDPTSGMRLFRRGIMAEFVADANYTPEPDTISYLLKNGAHIEEVQVQMDERIAGRSYLSFTRAAAYMVRMGMSILLIQWFRGRRAAKQESGEETTWTSR